MGINDIGFESGRFRRHHNLLATQGKPNITGPINKGKGQGNTAGKGHGKGNGAGGGAEPAFWVRTQRFNIVAANTANDYTFTGLTWTPKAAIFEHIGLAADGAVSSGSDVRYSFGATDGTRQWVDACRFVEGGVEGVSNTSNIALQMASGTDASLTFTSFGAGKVTLTGASSPVAQFITITVFGGTAYQAYANTTAGAASGASVTITPGFQAQAIFMHGSQAAWGASHNATPVIGYGSYDGTTIRQCGIEHNWNTPGGVRTSLGQVRADGVIAFNGGQTVNWHSITSTQFQLQSVGASLTGQGFGFLAMTGVQAWAGVLDSPSTTGNHDFTGPSFTPKYALLHTSRHTALNTNQTSGEAFAWSRTHITDTAQYCNHWRATDAAGSGGTVANVAEADDVMINTSDHRGLNPIDATWVQWNANGMRGNFTNNVSGLKWPSLFLA